MNNTLCISLSLSILIYILIIFFIILSLSLSFHFSSFFIVHSPYSKFKVGAAIRLADGSIVGGCNVENSAYSGSICAERTCAVKAISAGHREFKAMAVVAFQEASFTTPCGVCRQFVGEFIKTDIPVYIAKPSPSRVLVTSMNELLPFAFVPLPTD